MSSEHTPSQPVSGAAPTNGFKFFLPGLIIGFILGAVVGALVPPFVNRGVEPLVSPSGQGTRPATDRERYKDEAPVVTPEDAAPDEMTPEEVPTGADPEVLPESAAGSETVGG